jgi:hypothetical protein
VRSKRSFFVNHEMPPLMIFETVRNRRVFHGPLSSSESSTIWKTRPVVSVSGSTTTHGLGCWVDIQLKEMCKKLPSYLKTSVDLKENLLKLSTGDLSRAEFFTADAVSMYTNIVTNHSMQTIVTFCLRQSPLCKDISAEPIMDNVMRNNLFRFGDAY